MELAVIRSEPQYQVMLEWIDQQFDAGIQAGTPKGNLLEVALVLVKKYEDEVHQVPLPDPIEAVREKMDELGVRNQDLVGKIGCKSYVSQILSRKKPLTMEVARVLHRELQIPAEVLLQ
ncbi:MAG: type II toxin-antitoxin system HigA family antitoxin [Bacteroidota bacterium]